MPKSVSATFIFRNCDRSESTFCTQLAKIEHFNGRNSRPTERLELENNFPLIPAIHATELDKTQQVRHSPYDTVITET